MIGVDTNVLLRFLVDDDPVQNAEARAFLSARTAESPAFISAVALAETIWVLNRRLRYPMSTLVTMIRDLLASEAVVVENGTELGEIVQVGATVEADIADYLISWAGRSAGCTATVTFDKLAAKSVPGMTLLS